MPLFRRRRARRLELRSGRPSHVYAWFVIRLRWLVVLGWIVAAVAATFALPGLGSAGSVSVSGLVPEDAPALRTSARIVRLFDVPFTPQSIVVQRDPNGLSASAQRHAAAGALAIRERRAPGPEQLRLAVPLTNVPGVVPGSRERLTTTATYLFLDPTLSLIDQDALAARYVGTFLDAPDDATVGVTGVAPARLQEWREIDSALIWVTIAAIGVVAVLVGLNFRSFLAPIVTLAGAGVAYLVSVRVVSWLGSVADVTVPTEVEPIMVVLLLGIVTDYSVFYLARMRRRLAAGEDRLTAAEGATADFTPIVVTAGLIVAAGTATLLAGTLDFFRAFGPGMALTVLVSLAVSITLVPALLAVFGRALFWPSHPAEEAEIDEGREREAALSSRTIRSRLIRLSTAKPVAAMIVFACLVVLAAGCIGLVSMRLGFSEVTGLPSDTPKKRAYAALASGFAPGMLAPTTVLVEGDGSLNEGALERFGDELADRPSIAGVIGPGSPIERLQPSLVRSDRAAAARYLVVLDEDPLGGPGIAALRRLESDLPRLAQEAGLSARVSVAGDTALAAETVDAMKHDLVRIGIAAGLVNLLVLVVFLRALVAPLYLLAASFLALAASLGLTTFVFQELLDQGSLTYYVPFAVAVLLLSLGSDYNVFVVGRIWQEARRERLRDAIALAAPRASRTIAVAGLALALSFAALAIVPLTAFREFAFAMTVGILIDAFVVRSLLIPALISVFGDVSWWPSRRARTGRALPTGEHGSVRT